MDRLNAVKVAGKFFTLVGNEIKVGNKAPEFAVLAGDMSSVTLASSAGKTRLILAVPSLDTPVCDTETRRFNQEAAHLPGVEVLCISMDLPFAQKRFCQTAGIENLKTLSDHREASFGTAYGTLIKELRLLTRAVFVVDAKDTVTYVEYLVDISQAPHYEAVLQALKQTAAV